MRHGYIILIAASFGAVSVHGQTATTPGTGVVLMVGGVDGKGIVRQIQTDAKGYVICSRETPSSRPQPVGTSSIMLSAWTPQVDEHGFVICSKELGK